MSIKETQTKLAHNGITVNLDIDEPQLANDESFRNEFIENIGDYLDTALDKIGIPSDYVESYNVYVHKKDSDRKDVCLVNVKLSDKLDEQFDLIDADYNVESGTFSDSWYWTKSGDRAE